MAEVINDGLVKSHMLSEPFTLRQAQGERFFRMS